MPKKTGADLRKLQLCLLKFERRGLRPLAATLIARDSNVKSSLAAVAVAAALAGTLPAAELQYRQTLGATAPDATAAISVVESALSNLEAKVVGGADQTAIVSDLEQLFALVDAEHARLESFANMVKAFFLSVDGPSVSGTGGKNDPNSAWLSRVLSSLAS